jgi:hypothetical protein
MKYVPDMTCKINNRLQLISIKCLAGFRHLTLFFLILFIYTIFCDFSESDRKNEADGFDQVGNNPCNSEYRRSIFFYPFMNVKLTLSQ